MSEVREITRHLDAGPHQDPARGLVRLYTGLVLGGLTAVATVNWIVNPWRLYRTRLVAPRVQSVYSEKCDLMRRCSPLPAQLVLGSSRMMRWDAIHLNRVTGLPTFNAAVYGGTPADFLALYRFAAERLRSPVRRLIIGVEAHTFVNGGRNRSQLASQRELSCFLLRGGATPTASPTASLYNGRQTRDSVAALQHALYRPPEEVVRFGPGGTKQYAREDRWRERGEWEKIRTASQTLQELLCERGEIDPLAMEEFELLLAAGQRRGVEILVLATPMLDELRERWRANGIRDQEASVLRWVRDRSERYGARFIDFSHLGAFSGDPAEFYDSIHPTAAAARRMIEAMFPQPPRASQVSSRT